MIKQFPNRFMVSISMILFSTMLQAAAESCNDPYSYPCPAEPQIEAGSWAPWTLCDGDPKNPGMIGNVYGTDAQGGTVVCEYANNLHLILKNVCKVGGYWGPAKTPISACDTYLPYEGISTQNFFYIMN